MKDLYIHTDMKKKFDDIIIENNLIANLNFNIIEINSIDNNIDTSNILLKNYSGFLGIKYY